VRRLCETGGSPEIAANPLYGSNALRIENRDAFISEVTAMIKKRPAAQWITDLEAAGVPCGPINDLAQSFDNPQIKARGLRIDIERDDAIVPLVGNPIRFSKTPVSYKLAPPRLGQHTEQVLREQLNYDDAIASYMKTVQINE
jgi:formyl-CoA transferase